MISIDRSDKQAESERRQRPKWKFVEDSEMTPSERKQAMKEKTQNLREQEELERILADQNRRLQKNSQGQQSKQKEEKSRE